MAPDGSREIKQMTFENYWHEYFQPDLPLKNKKYLISLKVQYKKMIM
jgi:hypothetical protein